MRFKINGEEWGLIFVSPYSPILMNPDGSFCYGVTIPEKHMIYISGELSGEKLHHVLCHELTHAEFTSRGVMLPSYIEECLADIIADHELEKGNSVAIP